MAAISKADQRMLLTRLATRQTPDQMSHILTEISDRFQVRVLIASRLGFYRDAWTACTFAKALQASSVRLLWPAERPDFEIGTEAGLQQFEAVEADYSDRDPPRGDEYKAIVDRLDAGELIVEDYPESEILTSDLAAPILDIAARSKSDGRYPPHCNLVIHLNPSDMGWHQTEIEACMVAATAAARDHFAEVWVLWKGVAYHTWRQGEAVSDGRQRGNGGRARTPSIAWNSAGKQGS